MVRSERLIKLGDSWFSAKPILVGRCSFFIGGKALVERNDSLYGLCILVNL